MVELFGKLLLGQESQQLEVGFTPCNWSLTYHSNLQLVRGPHSTCYMFRIPVKRCRITTSRSINRGTADFRWRSRRWLFGYLYLISQTTGFLKLDIKKTWLAGNHQAELRIVGGVVRTRTSIDCFMIHQVVHLKTFWSLNMAPPKCQPFVNDL